MAGITTKLDTARFGGALRVNPTMRLNNVPMETHRPLPFLVVDNFVSPGECKLLIEAFNRNEDRLENFSSYGAEKNDYWDNRVIGIGGLRESEIMARRIMHYSRLRTIRLIQALYNQPVMFSDTIQLVRWSPGLKMDGHADNCQPDGTPNNMAWRDYSAVTYLNDDYEGGEFRFVKSGVTIKPRAGQLVLFTAGVEHMHEVLEVRGAMRYTMPSWYTKDVNHRDPTSILQFP